MSKKLTYFRKKGGVHVWEERPGKSPRYISYTEAKKKNLWSQVRNVSANVYKQLFSKSVKTKSELHAVADSRARAAQKIWKKEKDYSKQPQTKADQQAKQDWKSSDKEKKENKYVRFETLKDGSKVGYKKDGSWTLVERSKKNIQKIQGEVRRKAALKLMNKKGDMNVKEKDSYIKQQVLKDGSVIGYKKDGNWQLIKKGKKYVRTEILKDGTIIGYLPNGSWVRIWKGIKHDYK